MWSFSRIEWLSYKFIGQLSTESIDELLGGVSFRARMSILKQLLGRIEGNEEQIEEAVSAINEAVKLSERRNIFVHNPWRVYVDFDNKDFVGEFQKYTDEKKKVSRKELETFISESKASQSRLEAAFGAL